MSNPQLIKYVICLYLIWRLGLTFITAFGLNTLPDHNPLNGDLHYISAKTIYWPRWANWDGGHFLSIAQLGYKPLQTVFFPLYPLSINILSRLNLPVLTAGLIVSQISTIFALYYLYKLVKLDFEDKTTNFTLLLLLAFPTSFYLSAVYSESLFLALTLAAFYYARQKRWLLAMFLAGLSSITRLVGAAVIFALIIEYLFPMSLNISFRRIFNTLASRIWIYLILIDVGIYLTLRFIHGSNQLTVLLMLIPDWLNYTIIILGTLLICRYLFRSRENIYTLVRNKLHPAAILNLTISFSPLILYLAYQQVVFHRPFSFITSETSWNRHLTNPLEILNNIFVFYSTHNFQLLKFWDLSALEMFISLILIIGCYLVLRRFRISYFTYYFLSLIIFFSSNTVSAIA